MERMRRKERRRIREGEKERLKESKEWRNNINKGRRECEKDPIKQRNRKWKRNTT